MIDEILQLKINAAILDREALALANRADDEHTRWVLRNAAEQLDAVRQQLGREVERLLCAGEQPGA